MPTNKIPYPNCFNGAPDMKTRPPKIPKIKIAVPKSRWNKTKPSITIAPGKITINGFLINPSGLLLSLFRRCRAHHKIRANFANSEGCKVKPANSIQLRFPFTLFPNPGTNGRDRKKIESSNENLATTNQIAPFTRYAQ